MTRAPAVSVVIPTYGHRDFVLGTLKSVAEQSFTDFEIVVVNDGSRDDTESVLRPMIDSGAIHYVRQENQGQAAARNRGIELASGRYVALLDDDDLWPPDKLAWQVEFLEAHSEFGMVGGTADVIDVDGRHLRATSGGGEITVDLLFAGNPFLSPGQTLIRRDVLRAIGGFSADVWGADDWDAYFRIARAHRIQMFDRVSLSYRKHAGNASGDMARMLANGCKVVRSNGLFAAPAARSRLRRDGFRFVYRYAGTRARQASLESLRRGEIRNAFRQIASLAHFAGPAARDPRLLWWLVKDFVPGPVRALFRPVRAPVDSDRPRSPDPTP